MDDLLTDYRHLLDRVDAHAARVEGAWAEAFACRAGCSGCCQRALSVFPVEAESIRRWLHEEGRLPEAQGEPFVAEGVAPPPEEREPCAFLDPAGHCRIHPVRPVICRTHGLPLAVPDGAGGLRGDVCPLNFPEGMQDLPSTDFLSLSTINTLLAAIDQKFVLAAGLPDERVPLARLAEGA